MVFCRLSEGYYHRCFFLAFFIDCSTYWDLERKANIGRAIIFQARKKWSYRIMEFVDYEEEIPQNVFQINHTDVSKA